MFAAMDAIKVIGNASALIIILSGLAICVVAWLGKKSHPANLPESQDKETGRESFCFRHGIFYQGDACPFCKGPDNG